MLVLDDDDIINPFNQSTYIDDDDIINPFNIVFELDADTYVELDDQEEDTKEG